MRLTDLISFSYQALFAWLGVGLASFLGIIRVLPIIRLNKEISFVRIILCSALMFLVIISFIKIYIHWTWIFKLKKRSPKYLGFSFTTLDELKPNNGLVNKIESTINRIYVRHIGVSVIIVVFFFILLLESIIGEPIHLFFIRILNG